MQVYEVAAIKKRLVSAHMWENAAEDHRDLHKSIFYSYVK